MIKLLCVNIEGKKHINKILDLIKKVEPDVICMQEVFSDDVEKFTGEFGGEFIFSPVLLKTEDGIDKTEDELKNCKLKLVEWGNLILTNLPIIEKGEDYFVGDKSKLKVHRAGMVEDISLVLSSIRVKKENDIFNIATTHFCKSKTGEVVSEFQKDSINKLLDSMSRLGECIVCGDFNAPRGKEIFSLISEKYTDNIDKKYKTSLDPDLHKAGPLQFMVDGLFSTPKYKVSNMYFETGVSDHYAIVADIEI